MGIFIPDVERELFARIAPSQPVLAPRLASRLATLPDADVAAMLSSEAALARAVDWAIEQELPEQVAIASPLLTTPSGMPVTTPVLAAQTPVLVTQQVASPVRSTSPLRATSPMVARCVQTPVSKVFLAEEQDTTSALLARVAQLEPEVAAKVTERILDLGTSIAKECLCSDWALQQRVDAALGAIRREEAGGAKAPKVYELPKTAAYELPQTTYVSELPQTTYVSELPQTTYVSELPQTTYMSEQLVAPVISAPVVSAPVVSAPVVSTVVEQPVRVRELSPDMRSPSRLCAGRIWGLENFLTDLSLSSYTLQATEWASSMGAASLEELLENQDDFADALGLRPIERARLQRSGAEVAAQLIRLRPQVVRIPRS